jgi:alpha-beta hydrolase superfamily lysophospholipase
MAIDRFAPDRRGVLAALGALSLAACAPTVQVSGSPSASFAGPRFAGDRFVSFDGTRLGLTTWAAQGEPWAVIVGLHGMNAYARSFRLAAPWWAERGITTYAYDQRGFGRSPHRGVWADDATFTEDLRTAVMLARAAHPNAIIAVAGESMGGAVAIEAFASDRPPAADRLVLLSPAVWGWSSQSPINSVALWLTAHVVPAEVLTPPRFITSRIRTSDNLPELIDMGRDRLMIWGARSDALYGLVGLMERAWRDASRLRTPTAYLYGAHDEVIPRRPARQAARRLGPGARTALYAEGYHLLLVDLQAINVWRDVESFLRDPAAAFPSGVPPLVRPAAGVRSALR